MKLCTTWNDSGLLLWRDGADIAALRDDVGQVCTDGLLASAAQSAQVRMRLPAGERDVTAIQFSPAEAMDLLLALPDALPEHCGDSLRGTDGGVPRTAIAVLLGLAAAIPSIAATGCNASPTGSPPSATQPLTATAYGPPATMRREEPPPDASTSAPPPKK